MLVFNQNWGILSTMEGGRLMGSEAFRGTDYKDSGNWIRRAEKSKGAEGSEEVLDQWIGGLTDNRQRHCKEGLCAAERRHV